LSSQKGIYIHIPFCKSHCPYCDFAVYVDHRGELFERYVRSLCCEIKKRSRGEEISSVFFGGGTPSLLPIKMLSEILDVLRENFAFEKEIEISLEANPGALDLHKLKALRGMGVNRLSIGAQSFLADSLRRLGRIHSPEQIIDSVNWSREAGFENVSLDLIYGLSGQELSDWQQTLSLSLELKPTHLSCYSLTIEEGTPFARLYRDPGSLPAEESYVEMYRYACQELTKAGYRHYEVSNFAKEKYLCQHNLIYWLGGEFYGFGVSAHEFLNEQRRAHTRHLQHYIDHPCKLHDLETNLAVEEMMLCLRTDVGLDLSHYQKKHDIDLLASSLPLIKRLQEAGLVMLHDRILCLTEEGFFVSNELIAQLMHSCYSEKLE